MVWLLSVLGLAVLVGLVAALGWGIREIHRSTSAVRLERKLDPADVREIDRAFERVQRDVLSGD